MIWFVCFIGMIAFFGVVGQAHDLIETLHWPILRPKSVGQVAISFNFNLLLLA